ncbi:MAG: hypothetical protein ACLSAF_04740 [Intestinimonas sp.]
MRRFFTWALPVFLLLICVPWSCSCSPGRWAPGRIGRRWRWRRSVRRAAVQCYALEGAYPQDLSHLEERYGVSVDADRFRVDYIYIASNLMPDITIVPLSGA